MNLKQIKSKFPTVQKHDRMKAYAKKQKASIRTVPEKKEPEKKPDRPTICVGFRALVDVWKGTVYKESSNG